jgi:redox-sensitive bicupin YhaK (pirin superfamily)
LSYVLEGALEHEDTAGGGGVIRPGEIQLMRAGTGITHSEYNHSEGRSVHFLQIWILPDAPGLVPAYAQLAFDQELARRSFVLLASKGGRDGSLDVHQDVELYYLGTKRSGMSLTSRVGARLLLLGGPPFPEKILMWWNVVARTPEEIAEARADWEAHGASARSSHTRDHASRRPHSRGSPGRTR